MALTVGELIELLKGLDSDTLIAVSDPGCGCYSHGAMLDSKVAVVDTNRCEYVNGGWYMSSEGSGEQIKVVYFEADLDDEYAGSRRT